MDKAKKALFRRTNIELNTLPTEAQTAILSRVYQTGTPPGDATLDALAAGNYATAAAAFGADRERAYLAALGNAPPPAPAAPAVAPGATATPPPKP